MDSDHCTILDSVKEATKKVLENFPKAFAVINFDF